MFTFVLKEIYTFSIYTGVFFLSLWDLNFSGQTCLPAWYLIVVDTFMFHICLSVMNTEI